MWLRDYFQFSHSHLTYPKPLRRIGGAKAFFMLIGLRKQAFETSSHKKSLAALLQGFVARTGFEPVSPP
ncbi:MAG: hypothetical protein RLZ05_1413 [Bacteroidota bacterium]